MSATRSFFSLDALDVLTILYHVHRGAQQTEIVGFEDCERTLKQLTEDLAPARMRVEPGPLESGLWSCNLMDEAQQFWSPKGETFDQFLARVVSRAPEPTTFDKFYNLLRKKRGTEIA